MSTLIGGKKQRQCLFVVAGRLWRGCHKQHKKDEQDTQETTQNRIYDRSTVVLADGAGVPNAYVVSWRASTRTFSEENGRDAIILDRCGVTRVFRAKYAWWSLHTSFDLWNFGPIRISFGRRTEVDRLSYDNAFKVGRASRLLDFYVCLSITRRTK